MSLVTETHGVATGRSVIESITHGLGAAFAALGRAIERAQAARAARIVAQARNGIYYG